MTDRTTDDLIAQIEARCNHGEVDAATIRALAMVLEIEDEASRLGSSPDLTGEPRA